MYTKYVKSTLANKQTFKVMYVLCMTNKVTKKYQKAAEFINDFYYKYYYFFIIS